MVKEDVIKFATALKKYLVCKEDIDVKNLFLTCIDDNEKKMRIFLEDLPSVKKQLEDDLEFFFESDPAVDSKDEIILAYPGYLAITYHRLAHILYSLGYYLKARIVSEQAHFLTGIDIHPGANIACPFFIDHGTGIVIGETSDIGSYVKMYQGVTLGALSLTKGHLLRGVKRHPTIKNHVTIYAGASILGGDVVIGENVTIGSNVFLLKSIPDNYRVTLPEPELVLTERVKK
ncbi:MAG: serine acetyltransferase [Methanomicrobia archaeon]|jgi:serine O-acetyltransferase|nr:serine acetyltransferase [Methanomicrobia archaeon]